ncbi:hypothetical protein B6U81_03010 [Thermoplasmatales archaeon ex4484_30]|nr:MAG: hypothetical protein B6U81_03010 [Thermoplasmatales archaeon ex4484_30]
MNSATDNPLIFDDVLSGGNFHGDAIAIALDLMNIVVTKLGSFSERRVARLLDAHLSELPPFLAQKPGLNSILPASIPFPHLQTKKITNQWERHLPSKACAS